MPGERIPAGADGGPYPVVGRTGDHRVMGVSAPFTSAAGCLGAGTPPRAAGPRAAW